VIKHLSVKNLKKMCLKIQIMLENISVKNNPLIGGALPTGSPKNNES